MKAINTISWAAAIVIASSLAVVMPAFAQTSGSMGAGVPGVNVQGGIRDGANGSVVRHQGPIGGMVPPAVVGTVSAVNESGDTLTVTSKTWARPMPMVNMATSSMPAPSPAPSATYNVNASNATIYKGGATTTVPFSDIAVGDMVVVQGTVSGTNVTATVIRDGVGAGRMPGMPGRGFGPRGAGSSTPSGTPIVQGNGEPVIGGNVTAISGTTVTVTNASNVTYSIDAASTTIVKNGTSTAIGNIAVGDNVIVQGVVNGTSVTASSIIDQGASASSSVGMKGFGSAGDFGFKGIVGAIGGFFQHLFGF